MTSCSDGTDYAQWVRSFQHGHRKRSDRPGFLAQPLFHRPNLLVHALNYMLYLESTVVATSCVIFEKLPKATLHLDLLYLQIFWFTQWLFLH